MGPLDGIKVVEVGMWVAGPACGGILADWGADVVKIEPLTDDPYRGMTAFWEMLTGRAENPPFEVDNRGKRSVALDYGTEAGRAVLMDLVEQADVFVTNGRPGALARAGLDADTLTDRFPRLVYASVTGLGLEGPEANRPAYDVGMFWSRAGVASSLTLDGQTLPYQRGGMGDHMAGLAAAGGVAAALLERTRTGRGQVVATSLVRIGSYMISWDLNLALRFGAPTVAVDRAAPPNPLISNYRCADGRQIWLLGLEGDRHWPGLLEAIGRQEWAADGRFATLFDRAANAALLVAELDAVFATRTRAEWAITLDDHGVWWAPVQAVHELPADAQARAAGCFVDVPLPDGGSCEMPATPVTFARRPAQPARPVPELGQHTEEVLLDLGHDWDRIVELKDLGAII